jgi:1-acyl-sn-glycerol-3-phosphate acyltransferase
MMRALLFTDPLIIILTVVMGTLSMLASFIDSTGHLQHRVARRWARMLVRVSGVKVFISGLEKLDPHTSYVLVSNHLSLMDIPVLMGWLPVELRFFAKQGLFRIPFLGTHLRRAGHFPVVRDDPRKSLKSLTSAGAFIRQRGVSLLFFPEGGRSEGELREFKEGAAYLAIKAGIPVVPIGISGLREILPMGSIVVRPGRATVHVGDPIPTAGMKLLERTQFSQKLHEEVARLCS